MLNAVGNEARGAQAEPQRHSTAEIREAEARANRLLEQARHQATELTNSARAEVEATLEWARAQTSAILARAQHGAEQLLGSAGLRAARRAAEVPGGSRAPPRDAAPRPR